MQKSYHETLAKDYFEDLYDIVTNQLVRGENVCISVMPGFGVKTIFNFLNHNIKEDNIFKKVIVFDPKIEDVDIIGYTKNSYKDKQSQKTLIIVRFFEQTKQKNQTLEKLDSMRREDPKNLVFLVFTDHSAVLYPEQYQAVSTIFFTSIIYISPFNINQTDKMVASLTDFYGWKIDKAQYQRIFQLSGGVPRIIKYICKEISESEIPINNYDRFLLVPQIGFQLNLLSKILISTPTDKLRLLGLTNYQGVIKSQFLKYYFHNYKASMISSLYPSLGETEAKVLSYLVDNEEFVVSIDKIADLIKMSDDNFSLWAIYKLISRIKPKVKNNFRIKNVKGRGYLIERV